ncbi:hypothetical protein [Promicromonospora sp. NPDC090134]|uniref:hypothetical protein n=1 Tax=Promicromonospora sp. NPDC090134 TaxID=3364408 RepID=UPI003808ED83
MTEPELIEADRPEPAAASAGAAQWRRQMIQQLLEEGVLVDPAIADAFRAVPREVPASAEVDPRRVYEVHDVVRTRFTPDGTVHGHAVGYERAAPPGSSHRGGSRSILPREDAR